MHFFKASDISSLEKKKLLNGSVIPRPIALIVTQDRGIVNIAPFSYFNIVSNDPPIVSVAIQRNHGQMKDTARNILKTQEATLHIVSELNVEEANKTSASLNPDQSELGHTSLSLLDSRLVKTPSVKEASVRYELILHQHIEVKNQEANSVADLILLEVVAIHIDEAVYDSDKGYIITDQLKAVSRLAGSDYAKIGQEFSLKRPN